MFPCLLHAFASVFFQGATKSPLNTKVVSSRPESWLHKSLSLTWHAESVEVQEPWKAITSVNQAAILLKIGFAKEISLGIERTSLRIRQIS